MKTLLVGYGSMGKEIEKILIARGHEISGTVDPVNGRYSEITSELLGNSDVAIDFSIPGAVEKNCSIYTGNKTPVVLGTTGWESIRDKIKADVEKSGIGFVWGSNFSIGAHLFFSIVEKAAGLINSIPEYDILMYELHHKRKKDSPSGTALTAAEKIIAASSRKDVIITDKLDRQIKENELHVASVRGGEIPGTHTVMLDSPADTIQITHSARSRSGFALGAVIAAEWIIGKSGFIQVESFIKDFIKDI